MITCMLREGLFIPLLCFYCFSGFYVFVLPCCKKIRKIWSDLIWSDLIWSDLNWTELSWNRQSEIWIDLTCLRYCTYCTKKNPYSLPNGVLFWKNAIFLFFFMIQLELTYYSLGPIRSLKFKDFFKSKAVDKYGPSSLSPGSRQYHSITFPLC